VAASVDATILEAIENPQLWRPWFRDPESWMAWRTFLSALFGLELSAEQREVFTQFTAREAPREGGYREAWVIVGRRGGKSLMMAAIACYLAVFRDWSVYTVPGESALVQVLAVDRRQARIVHRYARAMLTRVPALQRLVVREQEDLIELSNGIAIEITTNDFRRVRGYTAVAALLDEVAFWRSDESANPDTETLTALRPAMATVPGSILIGASSPYAKRGVLYDAFRQHYAKDSPVLVWKAGTRDMHPGFPQSFIDEAMERDPSGTAAEYMAEFRSDIETFVAREVVDACTASGRKELPPVAGTRYYGFVDPSGGSADSMTLGIAHRERDIAVLDAVREVRPPFSPELVTAEFCSMLKAYKIPQVVGDRYGGEWPREQFRKYGVSYQLSDRFKSDIYRDILPALNSCRVELLDLPRLASQFCGLERRTARGGRDSVDHGPGQHDDVCNAVAGVLLQCTAKQPIRISAEAWARVMQPDVRVLW
jgi:hypothetical protein